MNKIYFKCKQIITIKKQITITKQLLGVIRIRISRECKLKAPIQNSILIQSNNAYMTGTLLHSIYRITNTQFILFCVYLGSSYQHLVINTMSISLFFLEFQLHFQLLQYLLSIIINIKIINLNQSITFCWLPFSSFLALF